MAEDRRKESRQSQAEELLNWPSREVRSSRLSKAIQQKRKEASDPIQKKRNHGMVVERNDVQDRKERYTQRRSKSDQVA